MGRRIADESFMPPTAVELELGHYTDCVDCPSVTKRWSNRSAVPQLHRCKPHARGWRRDHQNARRHGLPTPSLKPAEPHPFRSAVLGREVDLNNPATITLAQEDSRFRDELDAYIAKLATKERKTTKSAIRGLVGLPRPNVAPVRDLDEDEEVEEVSDDVRRQVDAHIASVNDTIEGEVVGTKKRRRRS